MTGHAIEAIGFVGLGVMGTGQSANLVRRSGLPVTVHDVDSAKMEPLVAAGAAPAASLAEVSERSDLVFLSLPSAEAVESVVAGPGGLLHHARAGQHVVDLSTSPVQLVRNLGERFADRGAEFADAPVARTRQAALDGTLSIMVGCRQEVFDTLLPFLRCMGSDVTRCGDVGAGAFVKLMNNMIVFETVVALAEALTLARRSGLVDDSLLLDVLGKGSAASFTLEHHGKRALVPDEHPEKAFSSAYMLKDLRYGLSLAQEHGVRLPAAELARDLLEQTCESGYRDNYHTSVVRVIEGGERGADR